MAFSDHPRQFYPESLRAPIEDRLRTRIDLLTEQLERERSEIRRLQKENRALRRVALRDKPQREVVATAEN